MEEKQKQRPPFQVALINSVPVWHSSAVIGFTTA